MPAEFSYQNKLKNWLAQNHLEAVVEALINDLEGASDPDAASLHSDAFGLSGRLRSAKREYNGGRLSAEDFSREENKIRTALINMIERLQPAWFAGPAPETRQQAPTRPYDPLDRVFKLLLLFLCLVSMSVLVYTMFFHYNREEKLPFIVLSVVGGSGAFYGYSRWRIVELQYLGKTL